MHHLRHSDMWRRPASSQGRNERFGVKRGLMQRREAHAQKAAGFRRDVRSGQMRKQGEWDISCAASGQKPRAITSKCLNMGFPIRIRPTFIDLPGDLVGSPSNPLSSDQRPARKTNDIHVRHQYHMHAHAHVTYEHKGRLKWGAMLFQNPILSVGCSQEGVTQPPRSVWNSPTPGVSVWVQLEKFRCGILK